MSCFNLSASRSRFFAAVYARANAFPGQNILMTDQMPVTAPEANILNVVLAQSWTQTAALSAFYYILQKATAKTQTAKDKRA